jgi:ABC-type nitrate/sulfonate/bicarbonate transport system substrate-binding protein
VPNFNVPEKQHQVLGEGTMAKRLRRRYAAAFTGVVVSLAITMSGCSGSAENASDNAGTAKSVNGLPGPEKTTLKVGISADDPHQFALQLAIDAGIFKKYGIDAEGRFFNSSTATTQALLAGQIDVDTSNATNVITSLTTSRPLVDIGVMINKLPDTFYGGKGIHKADDLRGKEVAISQFGGQSDMEAETALKILGLSVDDVHLTQTSGESARVSALQAGTVAAAPADSSLAPELEKAGITPLVDLRTSDARVPGSDIALRRDFVDKNPNLTLIIAAAALEAVQYEFTNTDQTAKYYAKWANTSEAESTAKWQEYIKSGLAQRDLTSTVDAYKAAQEVLSKHNPDIEKVDVSKAYDGSYLAKLESLNFFEKLGVPRSP